jgi:hypothetical protein
MKTFSTFFLLLCVTFATAQESENSTLFLQLKAADSLLFERSFNHCDFAVLEKLAHKDLQFLHDQGGMQNREEFFKSVRENICGNPKDKPIRKLVAGSLEVWPMKKDGKLYGAIQTGIHEFYRAEEGKPLRKTSIAKFIHVWLLENGTWQLYRVMSYDHQSTEK